MSSRVKRGVEMLVSAALALLVSSPAYADRITAGALVYVASSSGPITINLTSDTFTLDGRASRFSGVFMPWLQCSVPECIPGTSVDLFAHWSGLDLPGTATVEGTTFTSIGGLVSPASMFATWTGTLPIPLDFASGVLTAPFAFTGSFSYLEDPVTPRILDLFGSGTATATFRPYSAAPGALFLESLRYDFEAASPTPEPATLVLLGSGLAGLLAARARRRRSP